MPAPHPFMTFTVDTSTLPATTWFALGEAMSKAEHLAGVPLKPAAATQLSSVYLRRGVQATTAIEGNTLSDEEVQRIVDEGTAHLQESRQYLEREVKNILSACREIDHSLTSGERWPIDRDRLCDLNAKILEGIPDRPEVVPGELREHDVTAGLYRAPHYAEVPELVVKLTKWLAELRGGANAKSRREERFMTAVLAAILAHLYIAWIHPFGNGNGRLARLVEVQILSESGVVPIVATNLLSDHYNKTRNEYYRHLDLAQDDVNLFIGYAVRGFRDELREQIQTVRAESVRIHWESHVHDVFRNLTSSAAKDRQREVALCMPANKFLTPEEVTTLTTSLAKKYAATGDRTAARDMNKLASLKLVEKVRRRYRCRREVIEAFIPPVGTTTS